MSDHIIFRFLRKYIGRHKLIIFYALIISIAQSLLLIPSLYYIKQIFDYSLPEKNIENLIFNSAVIILITVLQSLMGYVHKNLFLRIVKNSIGKLQRDVLTHLMWSDSRFIEEADHAKMINSAVSDVDRVDRMTDGLLSVVIPQLTLFILGLSIMIVYNPIIGLATLLLGFIGYLAQRMARNAVLRLVTSYRNATDHFTRYVSFLPKKLLLTKLRNYEESELETAIEISSEVIKSGTLTAKRGLIKQTADELIINISATLLIVLGSFQILSNSASYGNIFGLYFLIVFIRRTANSVQSQWIIIQEGKVSLDRIFNLFSLIPPPTEQVESPDNFLFDGNIRGENLTFNYGKEIVLDDVNFEIKKGEVVAISGLNGSGKSSLVKLILGLYKPISGNLYANNTKYNDLNLNALRTQIGYVPQNQVLIAGTIESNLTYGLSSKQKEDSLLIQESRLFKKLLEGFKEGLKTKVRMDGRNLSNGQIQKISIIRSLYAKPSILILDEPTNHLDAESISTLISEIQTEMHISILVISHHKLFSEISDKCYELKEGQLELK